MLEQGYQPHMFGHLGEYNKMEKPRRKTIFWGIMFCIMAIYGVYVISNWDEKIFFFGPEEIATIGDAYICKGPDENGNPTKPVDKFKRTDWEQIYLCVYVIPKKQATLDGYWIFNKDGRSFANGPLVRIKESQYLYFSLSSALEEGNKAYYFNQELKTRDFPPGEYSVLLRQVRTPVLTIDFELTN